MPFMALGAFAVLHCIATARWPYWIAFRGDLFFIAYVAFHVRAFLEFLYPIDIGSFLGNL